MQLVCVDVLNGGLLEGLKGQGEGATVATQGSPDLQKSTAKQKSAVCITGVNKISLNFVTLVATYIYIYIYICCLAIYRPHSMTYIYVAQQLRVKWI